MKAKALLLIGLFAIVLPLAWAGWYANRHHAIKLDAQDWAPRFHGRAWDNKDYSMLDLSQKGAIVVCFLALADADTPAMMDRLSLLQKANPSDLKVVVIMRGDEKPVNDWAQKYSKGLAVIHDAYGTMSRDYKAVNSGELFLIDMGALSAGHWADFAPANLSEINSKVGSVLGRPANGADFGSDGKLGGKPLSSSSAPAN